MSVVIVGGGIVGLTSAYYLARAGLEVTLVERDDEVVGRASAANAGLIAPGHSFAWASPSAPGQLVASILGRDSSIAVARLDRNLIGWGMRFLRECTATRARRNTLVKLNLARASQALLEQVIEEEAIECHYSRRGVLYLYRSEQELEAGVKKMALVRAEGIEMPQLAPTEIVEADPALVNAADVYAGALHGLSDTTADCVSFATELLQRCLVRGVTVQTSTEVRSIATRGGRAVGVVTDQGEIAADRVVLSAGAWSGGIRTDRAAKLPVYPAKGYAIDVPVLDPSAAPQAGGLDERTLVAWSPKGDMLRMSASAIFTGFDDGLSPKAVEHMIATGREVFGDGLDWGNAQVRVGFRPMTPDGPPIIGASRVPNLYYNTGHGHMGWTMACASAVILRDAMLGNEPEMSIAGTGVRSDSW